MIPQAKKINIIGTYIAFQINKIDLVMDKIDHILDNYNELDFQIESYELNGMSKELISLRKEYSSYLILIYSFLFFKSEFYDHLLSFISNFQLSSK